MSQSQRQRHVHVKYPQHQSTNSERYYDEYGGYSYYIDEYTMVYVDQYGTSFITTSMRSEICMILIGILSC